MSKINTTDKLDEFHSVVTIELGELIKDGVIDFSKDDWKWDYYNEEQYNRVCKKIQERFWHREISLIPPGFWKREYLRKMNEIMPKYKLLYKRLDDGLNLLQNKSDYGKSRNIHSDFPQTQLSENSDYASDGHDKEYDHIEEGNVIEKFNDVAKNYNDIDVLILNEIEDLFSCLMTVNMNSMF